MKYPSKLSQQLTKFTDAKMLKLNKFLILDENKTDSGKYNL